MLILICIHINDVFACKHIRYMNDIKTKSPIDTHTHSERERCKLCRVRKKKNAINSWWIENRESVIIYWCYIITDNQIQIKFKFHSIFYSCCVRLLFFSLSLPVYQNVFLVFCVTDLTSFSPVFSSIVRFQFIIFVVIKTSQNKTKQKKEAKQIIFCTNRSMLCERDHFNFTSVFIARSRKRAKMMRMFYRWYCRANAVRSLCS